MERAHAGLSGLCGVLGALQVVLSVHSDVSLVVASCKTCSFGNVASFTRHTLSSVSITTT